jgi:uncharacterized repeat protein (TIGR01451 family)
MSRVVSGSGAFSGGRSVRRLLIAACLTVGACLGLVGLGASPAAAAGVPFNPATPTVFVAQGASTQLESAVESNGQLVFQNVGSPAGFKYNAIAYDTTTNFLYGVIIAGRAKVGDIIQIDSGGGITDTGVNVNAGSRLEDAGVFDTDNGNLYFGSSQTGAKTLFVYNPTTSASSTLTLSAAPGVADFAYNSGYLWGIGNGQIVRVDPTTGTVTDFAIPSGLLPGVPNFVFGAAWTYGNGNLGFSNNSSGKIYEIGITGAGTAAPTFTPVNNQSGPANTYNDGASIPGLPVDLALTKSASPAAVADGGQITYTLTVTNNGPGNSSGYVVDDPLPSGVTNANTATPGCSISAGVLTCQGNPLTVGATATITFTADAPSPNTAAITNTATVTGNEQDPNPANNTATATVQPLPGADLAITKTASSSSVTAGGQVTYTLAVTNNGPDDASGVTVSDPLPAGETLVSAAPSQGSCSGATCSLGTIVDGGQAQILLTVDIASSATGSLTNTATVSASTPDPNPANNTSTATVTIPGAVAPTPPTPPTTPTPRITQPSSDLQIVKRVNHAQAQPGQLLTYTLVVTNHGPDSASGVVVTDTPKMALTDVHAKPSQGTCTIGKTLQCSLGTIADGKTATIVVTGKVMKAGKEVNTGSVTSTSTDPTPGNNISRATTNVVAPAPKLSLSKTASPTKIEAGASVTYRIKVSVSGATAKNLKVCDALPLGLTFVSASPATALANGQQCWTIRSLSAGQSRTLILHARALTGTRGTLTNHATAIATGTKMARAEAKLTVTPPPSVKPPAGGVTG